MNPRVIDQDAAHDMRGNRKKVGAVLPVHPALIDELQVGLVHERGGGQGMVGTFASKRASRRSSP